MKKIKHKYNIGDIIETKTGKIEIIKQIRMRKNNIKGYEYKCLIDGYIGKITENDIVMHNRGCSVCCNRDVLQGYNDIATTNPWMIIYMKNKKDAYNYTYCSSEKIIVKCPICERERNKPIKIGTIYQNHSIGCSCGDGISYPEKIMYSVLEQVSIYFKTQLSKSDFDWCGNYLYDFYFEINNESYIIETHGRQHYENNGFIYCGGRSLKEEQENDRIKKELALQNGIKEENYIVIDCRKSELEFIKNNIINSKLNNIFNLNIIDWNKCEEFSCNSLVKKACDLWNIGIYTTNQIGEKLKVDKHTISKYLTQGNNLKWCSYNANKEIINSYDKMHEVVKKKVKCITTNEIFNSIVEAGKKYNISTSSITECCKGKRRKSVGKHPITGEKLKWMYILKK